MSTITDPVHASASEKSSIAIIANKVIGLGLVWLVCPLIADAFSDAAREIEAKFQRASIPL